MKALMSLLMMISFASFAGTRGQASQTAPSQGRAPMPMMQMTVMKDCPMNVQGVEIAVADTSDGIALTLTTKTGSVEELRRRVEHMASMHFGSAEKPFPMPRTMVAGVAKYESIPNGVRLTLTPKDSAQLAEFRQQVRTHVEQMKKEGGCSMMDSMMQGMMRGMDKPQPEMKSEPKKEDSEAEHNAHHPRGQP